MNDPAIEVEGLAIRYGGKGILDGASFEVSPGRVYALLGRNGSGKTSLVRCLVGQQRPDAGGTRLLGLDSWTRRASLMAEVRIVPEDPWSPPGAIASDLLSLGDSLFPRWDRSGAETRLRRFGVPLDLAFRKLSKGQKKLFELVFALAAEPRVLVLDDPSLGLDVVARKTLFEEIVTELADTGITVLVTTHDLRAMEGLADTVGVLHGGRLVIDEPLESLKARFRRLLVRDDGEIPDLGPVLAERRASWGRELVLHRYEEGSGDLLEDDRRVEVRPMDLESIVTAVTGGAP